MACQPSSKAVIQYAWPLDCLICGCEGVLCIKTLNFRTQAKITRLVCPCGLDVGIVGRMDFLDYDQFVYNRCVVNTGKMYKHCDCTEIKLSVFRCEKLRKEWKKYNVRRKP